MASNIEEANLEFLSSTFPFEGVQRLTETVLRIAEERIPKGSLTIRKSTHPWLTERGEEAVRRKHAAQGTEQEAEAARECSDILMEEHYDFVRKMRTKLMDAKPSLKSWWANARRLTDRKHKVSHIPALKRGTEWILDAESKANCFASSFETKNIMIDAKVNEYSKITYLHSTLFCGMPTIETTKTALKTLHENNDLNPDMIPTRILKQCANALAKILHKLRISI